ncbi:hypothetical protein E2C01_009876 [Portunus trituberculatus]|uniref:Uncharacterized protein n=1 Tax=Portunus trituberculatus TaxID=210409 RepID=A0A5B7D6V7_PORTR|nr:hypothetical protein [Portunus trituberculatus]
MCLVLLVLFPTRHERKVSTNQGCKVDVLPQESLRNKRAVCTCLNSFDGGTKANTSASTQSPSPPRPGPFPSMVSATPDLIQPGRGTGDRETRRPSSFLPRQIMSILACQVVPADHPLCLQSCLFYRSVIEIVAVQKEHQKPQTLHAFHGIPLAKACKLSPRYETRGSE